MLFCALRRCKSLLLQNAKGGELLGTAEGQIAFNLGSAIGARCGGLITDARFYLPLRGASAALLSFFRHVVVAEYGRLKHKQPSVTPVAG